MLGSNIGTELAFNAYEKVVEGYGGKGYYVENHDTLDETLKRAKEDAKLGYPVWSILKFQSLILEKVQYLYNDEFQIYNNFNNVMLLYECGSETFY